MDGKPPYEVVDAQPLMVLPDANKGDLFFDFEGDPLWTVDGREWGLEYLWGVLTTTDEFTPYWAHDRASERQALVDFLAMVRKRLKSYPGMHVYHYAAYEKRVLRWDVRLRSAQVQGRVSGAGAPRHRRVR